MNNRRKDNRAGFTLTEALVSSVILCLAVMVIMAISVRCMDRTRENRIYERAWQLLERQLAMVSYVGIDDYKKQGIMQGTFNDTEPEYNWAIKTWPATVDMVENVRIMVSWRQRNSSHNISLTTRMRSFDITKSYQPVVANVGQ